jgi:hypothetical protein
MIVLRRARRICVCLFACALLACKVYDPDLSKPATSDSGQTQIEAGHPKDACVPSTEICNGVDDDCDETIDETTAVLADCATHVLHASSQCVDGVCVYLRECETNYFNCDGRPENGCESGCPCTGCVDASATDDAGDDAG